MAARIPLVGHLALEPEPHLIATECTTCGARFFGRRNACASCSGTAFKAVALDRSGELVTFTIVNQAAPGVRVPFVAGVVDCAGTSVAANIINTDMDPRHVVIGMKVRLATYSLGTDDDGTEAIGFGFEPVDPNRETS
jgi:uncharacterized protein